MSALDLTLAETEDSPRLRSVTKGAVSQRELHTRDKAKGAGAVITQVKERQAEVTSPVQTWLPGGTSAGGHSLWGIAGTLLSSHPNLLPGLLARDQEAVYSLSQGHRGGSESHIWVLGVSPGLVGTW